MLKLYKHAVKHKKLDREVVQKVRSDEHAYFDWTIVLRRVLRDEMILTGVCDFALGIATIF